MAKTFLQLIRTLTAGRTANIASSTNASPIVATRTAATALTVSAASNTTPVELTVTTAHGFKRGDIATCASVGGNTAANTNFRVVPTSTTKFTIFNVTTDAPIAGNGTYTSGGTVTPWTFQNGDIVTVASHLTNTAANGTFSTSASSATVQTLLSRHDQTNTTGNGVGGATGTITATGQTYSPSLDISAVDAGLATLHIRVHSLTAAKQAQFVLHDTVDAFANYQPVFSHTVQGGVSQSAPYYFAAPVREIQRARFGVTNAKLRLHVLVDSGAEIEYDAFLEY